MSPAAMSSPQSAFHHDTSNDSLPSAMNLGQHHQVASSMDPRGSFRQQQQQQQQQQPRNSPGPVRRPIPVPASAANNGRVAGSSNPPPPVAVQQPMGLPRQAGKLVPGRMSSGRENQTQQSRDETRRNWMTAIEANFSQSPSFLTSI